ncbi:hypothetical protein K438DRAFT_1590381, partial [Mycena galopus ATCC 62051]
AYLEAALGMESGFMGEASRLFTLSEARAKAKRLCGGGRLAHGLIVGHRDAVRVRPQLSFSSTC